MTNVLPRPSALLQPRQRSGEPNPGRFKPKSRSQADLQLVENDSFTRRYDTVDEKVAALVFELDSDLPNLCTTSGWDDFVDAAARMPRFSANNLRLIRLQLPDATDVADFKTWRDRGRNPKAGSAGLCIMTPAKVKVPLTDPDDEPLLDSKGQQIFDERATGDTAVSKVFDISQTEGAHYTGTAPFPGRKAFAAAFGPATDTNLNDPEEAVADVARMRLDVLGGDDTNIEAEAHAVAVVIARRWGVTEPVAPSWVDRSPAAVRASSIRVSRVVSRLIGTPILP